MPKIKGIGCMRRENTAREKRATFSSPLQCFEVLWWKEPVVTLSLSATRLLHEMSSSSPFPTDPFTVLVPQNKPLRCSHLSIDGFCCEKVGRAIQLSSLTIGRKRAFLIEFVKRNGRKIWLLLSLSLIFWLLPGQEKKRRNSTAIVAIPGNCYNAEQIFESLILAIKEILYLKFQLQLDKKSCKIYILLEREKGPRNMFCIQAARKRGGEISYIWFACWICGSTAVTLFSLLPLISPWRA